LDGYPLDLNQHSFLFLNILTGQAEAYHSFFLKQGRGVAYRVVWAYIQFIHKQMPVNPPVVNKKITVTINNASDYQANRLLSDYIRWTNGLMDYQTIGLAD